MNFLISSSVTGLALVDASFSREIVDVEVFFTVSIVRSLIVSSFGIGVVDFEASFTVLFSVVRLVVVPSSVECHIILLYCIFNLKWGAWWVLSFTCTLYFSLECKYRLLLTKKRL